MKIIHIITAATFMLASSVTTAATIWAPTNSDTDFINFDAIPGFSDGISTNGGSLALFDDSDFGGTALVIGAAGGHVVFTDNLNGTWKAEVFDVGNASGGSITLSGNTNFVLGMAWDGVYYGDSNSMLVSSPDTYAIIFDGITTDDTGREVNISGNTLAVDLAPIPVPAAAWLFGTGLLGLVAVARRRA